LLLYRCDNELRRLVPLVVERINDSAVLASGVLDGKLLIPSSFDRVQRVLFPTFGVEDGTETVLLA